MILRPLLCVLVLLAGGAAHAADPSETEGGITIESVDDRGGGSFDLKTGIAVYTNRAIARYQDASLEADTLRLLNQTGEALAEGDVIILRDGMQLWRGERISYNFRTRVMTTPSFRAGQPPYFVSGSNLVTIPADNAYVATNGTFTTDDRLHPGYRIRAKKIIIVPGKYVEARHAVAYAGNVPVMYFPYFHKAVGRHPNHYDFLAGYRSSWGPFLLNSYNWYWNDQLHGAVNLDLRGERGVAGGPDFRWHDPTFGEGLLRYYYAHDIDPERVFGFETPDRDRQRVLFQEQLRITPNLTARSVVAYQSDPFIIRDFFESEYHDNVQPKSYFELNQQWPDWSLNGLAQFRVNDFQETVERLPDVKLTGLRQQVASTPLYYESESSVGYFRHLFPDETNTFFPRLTNSFGATRADTYHQVLLPWTFFGWLNVIPRVGQRLTYYSEANERGGVTDEEYRGVFNTGAEFTWKASRLYRNVESDWLEVDGLRHIIEPSVNYVYVPDPDERPRSLPQFDTELPSSRLLPIEFPDYNSIDSIDSQQTVRFGLRNKLQTKREGRVENLLQWALYADWRLMPHEAIRSPAGAVRVPGQHTLSDIYSDIDFRPRSWMTLNSETRYSTHEDRLREANHTLTIQPGEVWSVSLGHRYRVDTIELGRGNSLIHGTVYYRLNENWGVRISEFFEARDGVLEYQYYTLYRDFRSWTGALTFRVRDDRFGPTDYTVAFTLSLKAFPRYGVGDDAVRPSRLIGG